jgi:hypothetical protein
VSRYTTRHGVAAWLGGTPVATAPADQHGNPIAYGQPATVAGVGTVYVGFNAETDQADMLAGLGAGAKNGALLQVDITHDQEVREAMGGATDGWKRITYRTLIRVFGRSIEEHVEIAVTNFDDVLEAIKARIRTDRTLGSTVFQAGEGVQGIQTENAVPVINEGVIELYAQLTLNVVEHIRG